MTNTPRTDAAIQRSCIDDLQCEWVEVDFARKIERENAALRERLRDSAHSQSVWMQHAKQSDQKLAAAQQAHQCDLDRRANIAASLRKAKDENAALLDVLESMANQHCHTGVAHRDYNGQLAGTLVTDSGALTANGKALHLLANANPPRFRIVAEFGRMVVGYWPENDPEKHPRTNPVSQ